MDKPTTYDQCICGNIFCDGQGCDKAKEASEKGNGSFKEINNA